MTDEDRLAREHTAFLASVLGGDAVPDVQDDEREHATPEEVATRLGRRERELTPADAAAFRREPDDGDPEDEHEPPSEATTASGEFIAALRRQRGNRPPPERTPQ